MKITIYGWSTKNPWVVVAQVPPGHHARLDQ
jgi:hypothetical protein